MGYKEKLTHVVDLTKKMFENIPVQENLVYIDGGEMVGTSTLIEGIKAFDTYGECIYTREPSRATKKAIISKFGDRAFVDTVFIKDIIDMFMKDRKQNQSISDDDPKKLIISDRGIFSTIVYQSGILDPSTSIADIVVNCNSIYETAVENGIRMPKLAINLCSNNDNHSELDRIEFIKRLNKRINNKEQELDALDNVADAMVINRIYSDLSFGIRKFIPSCHTIEFKKPADSIKHQAIDLIHKTYNVN